MKGGVDVIGAAFGGAHAQALAREGGDEARGQRGLAGARAWRGNEERACGAHATSSGTRDGERQQLRAHSNDGADGDDGGWREIERGRLGGDAVKRGEEDALLGQGRRGDDGRWRGGGQPAGDERGGDRAQIAQAHIKDDGLAGLRERGPVEAVLGLALSRHQDQRAVDAAHGGGDRGHGQRGEARGHAGDDAEGDAGAGERQRLLAAAAEHAGIAALQAQARACLRARAQ